MVEEHGGDMSARDRKDARRIQAEFAFEDAGRPGRRAGGGPQNAPTGGGTGSGDRRRAAFGGSLTTPQSHSQAQTPARQTPVASRSSTPSSDRNVDPAIAEYVEPVCDAFFSSQYFIGDTDSSCRGWSR